MTDNELGLEKEDGTFKKISDNIKEYTRLLSELKGSKEDLELDDLQLEVVVRSSAQDVVEEAYVELVNEIGDESEIPFENPQAVILESERQFSLLNDSLVEEIERIQEKEEGSVTGADIDTMLYLIDKNAGKSSSFTVYGGAESLIYNTGQRYGWHPYETELVLKANRIAAERNNLERHLLLDKVLIVPNDERMVYGSNS